MNNLKELEQQLQDLENKSKQVRAEIKRQSEKPELEEGKWYWVDRGELGYDNALIYFQGKLNNAFGFNHGGEWTNGYGCITTWTSSGYKITLATTEEVEKALIKEAERLGFEEGVRFKEVLRQNGTSGADGKINSVFYYNKYDDNEEVLLSGGRAIYCNGKWAEIINKYEDGELYLLNDLRDIVPTLAYYDTNRFYDNEEREWKEDEWDNIELANQENLEKWKN